MDKYCFIPFFSVQVYDWLPHGASAHCSAKPAGWIEHMILVMKLNSFPVMSQTVLFARKHTDRKTFCPRSNSVKLREHLSKGPNFYSGGEQQSHWNSTAEINHEKKKHPVSVDQRGGELLQAPNIPCFISDTFFNSLSICYVFGLLSLSWGWELSHTQKRHFEALRVLGWWW